MRSFQSFTLADFSTWLFALTPARTITHLQIHHTWRPTHADYAGERTIRGMWEYHVQTNGWQDIGQHLSIAPDGMIWDGRDFELDPACIQGHNSGGICIEMIGDFDEGQDVLEGNQLTSVITTCALLLEQFTLNLSDIVFHNDHSEKSCPGTSISKDWFIRQVEGAMDAGKADAFTKEAGFHDVPSSSLAARSIDLLHGKGILAGDPDGSFRPKDSVTREELAMILHRLID